MFEFNRWITGGARPHAAQTEPAELHGDSVALRRIADLESADFKALSRFLMANPNHWLETQGRLPTQDDAKQVVMDLPQGAKPAQKYVWGVWQGDTMIGMLACLREWPQGQHLYIVHLIIGERWQRHGHGRAVLKLLAERTRSWAKVHRWRLAVLPTEDRAVAFWRAMGFLDTGRRSIVKSYAARLMVMEKAVGR